MLELDPEGATYRASTTTTIAWQTARATTSSSWSRITAAPSARWSASTDELSPDRALDRDLVIHEARLAIHQLSERRDWAGSSRGAEHIGNALFPIFTRDYAPLNA